MKHECRIPAKVGIRWHTMVFFEERMRGRKTGARARIKERRRGKEGRKTDTGLGKDRYKVRNGGGRRKKIFDLFRLF